MFADACEMRPIHARRAADGDTYRVQRDRMMMPGAKQQLPCMRYAEKVFGMRFEPSCARGAGRHLREMRQAQADAGRQRVVHALARDGSRARHVYAFGFKLPLTMRSQ